MPALEHLGRRWCPSPCPPRRRPSAGWAPGRAARRRPARTPSGRAARRPAPAPRRPAPRRAPLIAVGVEHLAQLGEGGEVLRPQGVRPPGPGTSTGRSSSVGTVPWGSCCRVPTWSSGPLDRPTSTSWSGSSPPRRCRPGGWASTAPPIQSELLDGTDEHVTVYAIDVDGQVVGIVQSAEEPDEEYRQAGLDIAVDPAWHGTGVALDALRTLAAHLLEARHHHHLTIDPAAANGRAIAAYTKLGFRPVGRAAGERAGRRRALPRHPADGPAPRGAALRV